MNRLWIVALPLALLLAGCSSGQNFSNVTGNLRITGQIQENVFSPEASSLSLYLTDATTGYPLDATDVDVKAGNARIVHAARERLGSYTAHITDSDHIDLLIVTHDRAAHIALQRQ